MTTGSDDSPVPAAGSFVITSKEQANQLPVGTVAVLDGLRYRRMDVTWMGWKHPELGYYWHLDEDMVGAVVLPAPLTAPRPDVQVPVPQHRFGPSLLGVISGVLLTVALLPLILFVVVMVLIVVLVVVSWFGSLF